MTDDAMTEQLRQFYALSSEQQAAWLGPLDAHSSILHPRMACAPMLTSQAFDISTCLCGGQTTIPSTRAPRSELITLMSHPCTPPSFGSNSVPQSQPAKLQS